MLSYKKEQLLKKFSDTTLSAHPSLLKKFGYQAEKTCLEISGYRIFCTPYSFSLRKCRLLVSLREEEIEFFSQFSDKLNSLYLTCSPEERDPRQSFFIKGRIPEMKKAPGYENVWVLDFQFKTESDSYVRHFLTMADMNRRYYEYYLSSAPAVFGTRMLMETLGTDTLLISKKKQKIGYSFVHSVSVNFVEVVLNLNGYSVEEGDRLSLICENYQEVLKLYGKVSRIEKSKEIDEFHELRIDLEFHMGYIDRLAPYLDAHEPEELDETETGEGDTYKTR
jgi:hypothetical protein